MKTVLGIMAAVALAASTASAETSGQDGIFADELLNLQQEFDHASFAGLGESDREHAFDALVSHAADFSKRYPDRVEAVAWNGIVLSTYAGEVGAMSAMKYAKAARTALHKAEKMQSDALDGGVYASLGALYAKVPGGLIGFGDDDLAAEYFEKALAIDPDSIDANYFYGEFLIDQKQYDKAVAVLERALAAPAVTSRPLFDKGRRAEIETMLTSARSERS